MQKQIIVYFYGFLHILFLQILTDFYGFLRIPTDFYGFLRISTKNCLFCRWYVYVLLHLSNGPCMGHTHSFGWNAYRGAGALGMPKCVKMYKRADINIKLPSIINNYHGWQHDPHIMGMDENWCLHALFFDFGGKGRVPSCMYEHATSTHNSPSNQPDNLSHVSSTWEPQGSHW